MVACGVFPLRARSRGRPHLAVRALRAVEREFIEGVGQCIEVDIPPRDGRSVSQRDLIGRPETPDEISDVGRALDDRADVRVRPVGIGGRDVVVEFGLRRRIE